MKSQYDSPLAKRTINYNRNKLTTPTFQKIRLFKTKQNLSSSDLMINIPQDHKDHNFTLKMTKNQEINLKKSKNPIEYDSEYLKSDLIAFRSEVQKRKNELLLLKIKYGKLLVDNINNKTLIFEFSFNIFKYIIFFVNNSFLEFSSIFNTNIL